jgi:Bacterial regulatory protein, Fis family
MGPKGRSYERCSSPGVQRSTPTRGCWKTGFLGHWNGKDMETSVPVSLAAASVGSIFKIRSRPSGELDALILRWGFIMNEVETKTESKINGDDTQGRNLAETSEAGLSHLLGAPDLSLRLFRDEAEMRAINSALNRTGWNRKRAAQLLSISYRGLLYKIRRHKLSPPAEQS